MKDPTDKSRSIKWLLICSIVISLIGCTKEPLAKSMTIEQILNKYPYFTVDDARLMKEGGIKVFRTMEMVT